MGTEPMGRRERKKAATRKAISDAATLMFIERGFDEVSIREIAEAADVSPTTVFAHFAQKEAIIFDEDDEQREQLVSAVRDRPRGTTISAALRAYYLQALLEVEHDHDGENLQLFMDLIDRTPALRDYAARMWLRHEDALADAIAVEFHLDTPSEEIRAYARFVLQIQLLATGTRNTRAVIEAGFRVLDAGWAPVEAELSAR
ncbi:TetR/AcrR family transcriptional regulator [Protaetiibacter mangrovi]|uniref:TetR/AcrR family transcriptional regulator n=1 Tax=Protaetiibacter mangrovi TaxID=2970926 RepID=A0ABT1ZF07_9MICO|nr:TetR/AcrR family transcriptional regulator [Protaetiibacter mangrovi]MCS0499299.1 TetR/AcrR family transcriptional regulator [Protaetiibacter mangrovi]TPW94777.1 TetR family transcriptional regulator [Schumannella luteola]